MKQLTITDVRCALYDMLVRGVTNEVPDEELLNTDFWFGLRMDEQQVLSLAIDLQRTHHIFLPAEVLQALKADNTVGRFLEAANALLQDLDED